MTLTPQLIEDYLHRLAEDERGAATIDKYRRDLLRFYEFLPPDKAVDKAVVLSWKEQLVARKYASSSVNVMLASVNGLLTFAGRPEWRAKFLKRQRAAFCDERRELRRAEYEKLVATARREKKTRLTLMMETICSTGIRVSELAFVTVEAARAGRAELMLKGKCRRILCERKAPEGVFFKDARTAAVKLRQDLPPRRAADTVRHGKELAFMRIGVVLAVGILCVDDFLRLRNERLYGGHGRLRSVGPERAVHEVMLHIHNDQKPLYCRHFFSSLMRRSAI